MFRRKDVDGLLEVFGGLCLLRWKGVVIMLLKFEEFEEFEDVFVVVLEFRVMMFGWVLWLS